MNRRIAKTKPARRRIKNLPQISPASAVLHIALIACMVILNFALPRHEPLAFALFYAAIVANLNAFAIGAGYLLSSVAALSLYATLACALQATLLACRRRL